MARARVLIITSGVKEGCGHVQPEGLGFRAWGV